ncbi:MAG: hypothetical protein F6K56_22680 [Moorea sp. SIO3G5]|nr:hypothetical protein [Moorena sp. SIO3G5]
MSYHVRIITLNKNLPISLSPYLPISLSPYLPISLSPHLPTPPTLPTLSLIMGIQPDLISDHQCVPTVAAVEFQDSPVSVSRQQVAQLVERPVEIVEYQYHTCKCVHCHRLCH